MLNKIRLSAPNRVKQNSFLSTLFEALRLSYARGSVGDSVEVCGVDTKSFPRYAFVCTLLQSLDSP